MNYQKTILIACLIFGLQLSTVFAQNSNPEPVSMAEALEMAADSDKKILIDVYAAWCPYCQRMHSDVYQNDEVLSAIDSHFIWVKINVESDRKVKFHGTEMTEAQFARALDNENVPTTYFMNSEGAILGLQPGFIEADMFSTLLNFVGSDAYLSQTFDEYRER
ncbi:MAG: thioredoxin family protein [Balneolaceae bacterium]|nr:thioredoxin family protein [Balneolaceae bacterium]MCH8547455.1 thioredoxin family protein [Balneolaceae bacterium]